MTPTRPSADLRHHAARRRAVARLQHDPAREAARGARAGGARCRCNRGGISGRLARGLGERECGGARGAGPDHLRRWPAATREDIELAARALGTAPRQRIHVFLATSAIHRQYKLNMAQEEILRRAVEGVPIARELLRGRGVLARGRLAHRARVPGAGRRGRDRGGRHHGQHPRHGRLHGAGRVRASCSATCASTCAASTGVRLSVHCHDDLGMAVANSLTAVVAGARQIECTINGIGERAGNCSLEEVVMALKTRAAFFNLHTGVNTTRLYPTSRLVSSITGMPIPRNKAVVGENAFAHEAGIHQHGMLQEPHDLRDHAARGRRPARAATWCSASTAAATRSASASRQLGFELDEAELNRVFEEFKALADKKKELFDGDIEALVLRAERLGAGPWTLAQPGRRGPQRRAAQRHRAAPARRRPHGRAPRPSAMARSMPPTRRSSAPPASAVTCANSRCTRSPRARTRRARRSCTWSTTGAATAARASAPTSSRRAQRALLEVINRIELSQQTRVRAASAMRPAKTPPATGSQRRCRKEPMPIPATPYIWFNGKLVAWEKATVHVLAHALHYGSSVFEGVRAYATPRAWRSSVCTTTPGACSTRRRSTASQIPFTRRADQRGLPPGDRGQRASPGAYIRPIAFAAMARSASRPKIDPPVDVAIAAWEWGKYLGHESEETASTCASRPGSAWHPTRCRRSPRPAATTSRAS